MLPFCILPVFHKPCKLLVRWWEYSYKKHENFLKIITLIIIIRKYICITIPK